MLVANDLQVERNKKFMIDKDELISTIDLLTIAI
jgi:hypothetical protein